MQYVASSRGSVASRASRIAGHSARSFARPSAPVKAPTLAPAFFQTPITHAKPSMSSRNVIVSAAVTAGPFSTSCDSQFHQQPSASGRAVCLKVFPSARPVCASFPSRLCDGETTRRRDDETTRRRDDETTRRRRYEYVDCHRPHRPTAHLPFSLFSLRRRWR